MGLWLGGQGLTSKAQSSGIDDAETVEGYGKAWVLKGADKSPEGFVRLLESLESK